MSALRDTFIDELKDTYDAEHQIIKALPKAIKNAEHQELKEALESHLEETRTHVQRLEQVFEIFDETAKGKKCKGMQGLIAEGEEMMEDEQGDAALISALQKVEHYEIAAYGSLAAWAKLLQEQEAADILEETLNEENDADAKLTEVAENAVNANEENESEDEEEEKESPRRK